MDWVLESSAVGRPAFIYGSKLPSSVVSNRNLRWQPGISRRIRPLSTQFSRMHTSVGYSTPGLPKNLAFGNSVPLRSVVVRSSVNSDAAEGNFGFMRLLVRRGVILAALVCGIMVVGCRRVFAVESVVNTGYGVFGQSILLLRNAWPKVSQLLRVFKEQGLILAVLLGLSAFFSMAETSITTLWPWKVRELAEKEPENGVFKMLRSDVAILLLTEITPKSIAVHNATEVARFVDLLAVLLGQASSMALIGVISCGKSCYLLVNGDAKTAWSEREKSLLLKSLHEPYVTEEELKLMLRGAILSGAIEEEEQDMIENVLEIKDTYVREVMTPLVDVVAIDASSTLIDFHNLWVTHQYSRQGELLESSTVGDMAHKPAYFVPDSMSVWNLLREFRIRKVHMAVVLNEYGGTVGIVTLEDVVEEIVGEIFDENDSKEEIQKKTGYIVMRAQGVYDVDANTSIDQLSEDLNIKMPEGHQYETVSGFICEAFGYIPRTGESVKVVLEKENMEEVDEYNEDGESERKDQKDKETHQVFKLEILAGNARKVSAVRFERIDGEDDASKMKEVTRVVPKIIKRKCSSDDDEYLFPRRPESDLSDDYPSDQNEDIHIGGGGEQ
ncbi:hypothetical protein CDL15_Pgr007389 [Punica granatum]|uniref:CBS domain-containing protein n=1 Tax=Punica granatum TaxID=22663 RepID=A0A218XA09_PUNGR|nr:hypothetical protein CDL15_Pgr007389 [Punica granatum]